MRGANAGPLQIFGKMDNHVPPAGRDLIRKTLTEKSVTFSFYEIAWAQRKLSLRPLSIYHYHYLYLSLQNSLQTTYNSDIRATQTPSFAMS